MTYSFDSLYQDWVTEVTTNVPSTPSTSLTVERFVEGVQADIEDMINEGDEVPESHLFVIENYNP